MLLTLATQYARLAPPNAAVNSTNFCWEIRPSPLDEVISIVQLQIHPQYIRLQSDGPPWGAAAPMEQALTHKNANRL